MEDDSRTERASGRPGRGGHFKTSETPNPLMPQTSITQSPTNIREVRTCFKTCDSRSGGPGGS